MRGNPTSFTNYLSKFAKSLVYLHFRFSKEITPIKQRNSSINSQGEKSSKSSAHIHSTRMSKWNNENVNNQNFTHRRWYSKDKKVPMMFNNFIQPEVLHIGKQLLEPTTRKLIFIIKYVLFKDNICFKRSLIYTCYNIEDEWMETTTCKARDWKINNKENYNHMILSNNFNLVQQEEPSNTSKNILLHV